MVFYIVMYVVVENIFVGFFIMFLVKELKWSSYEGSYIIFGYWVVFVMGRFLGIFFV